jgi:alanine racemase
MDMAPHPSARVWLDIDLGKLRRNLARIRERVAPCGVIAVLKADAYGLGVEPIAAALAEAGVAGFAVAEPREALRLTGFGLPVQILGGILPDEIPATVAAGIIHPIDCLATARRVSEEAVRQNRTVECHFLIDTGMGRLGLLADAALPDIVAACQLPGLDCRGIYSHFPVAYRAGEEYTLSQIARFRHLLDGLAERGIVFPKVHMANSDAINNFPQAFVAPFNLVRTGINLHGSFDSEGLRSLQLEPVLELKSRLVSIRRLPAGMQMGYGLTYRLLEETPVGTVAAGYADGLPLALSNRGYLLIRGALCPVLARVSMDYVTVSLANVPDAAVGDEVVCLGGTGPTAITVDQWAELKGTHPYEIICSFGSRVERRYLDPEENSR